MKLSELKTKKDALKEKLKQLTDKSTKDFKNELLKSLSELSLALFSMAEYEDSKQLNEKARLLAVDLKLDAIVADCLNLSALIIQSQSANHDSALKTFEEAFQIVVKLDLKERQAEYLVNIGTFKSHEII